MEKEKQHNDFALRHTNNGAHDLVLLPWTGGGFWISENYGLE